MPSGFLRIVGLGVAGGLTLSAIAHGQCLFSETRTALELEVRECIAANDYFTARSLTLHRAEQALAREAFDEQWQREPGVIVRATLVRTRSYRQSTTTGRIDGWTSPWTSPTAGSDHDYFLRDTGRACDGHPRGEILRKVYAPICCDVPGLGDLACQLDIPALDSVPGSLP